MPDRRMAAASRVEGEVTVGGDKSISHRALIIGAIAAGRSYIGNLSEAADVQATVRCLTECGVWARSFGAGRASVEGAGPGRSLSRPQRALDCANSGTTMRLLAGVLAGHSLEATLDGDASLRLRPMRRVAEPLSAMGAVVETAPGGTPPVRIRGSALLRGVEWRLPVASAQLKSAVLLAALGASGETTVVEPAPSRDHTERLLQRTGIDIARVDGRITVRPGTPLPFGLRIPGDISSAAFFLALAAARPGWSVRCPGLGLNPGRTGIVDVLRAMGATVEVSPAPESEHGEPAGDLEVHGRSLSATRIAGELTVRCLDEIPVVAVLATQAEGTTEIHDAADLRTKESDRISRLAEGLRALGARCETFQDGLAVSGPVALRSTRLDSAGDHRLAMAWAVAGVLCAGGAVVVAGAEAASVSYPRFFDHLATLTR